MRRDLEHRVGARVDDRLPGAHVLRAQLLDDLGPGSGAVPEPPQTGLALERAHHLGGEPVGIRGERLLEPHPHHLPVTGGRVLAKRHFGAPPPRGGRRGVTGAPGDLRDVPETPRLQIRQVQAADSARGVAEGVRADVAEESGVRQLAGAD